jgi:hypothetical protein
LCVSQYNRGEVLSAACIKIALSCSVLPCGVLAEFQGFRGRCDSIFRAVKLTAVHSCDMSVPVRHITLCDVTEGCVLVIINTCIGRIDTPVFP